MLFVVHMCDIFIFSEEEFGILLRDSWWCCIRYICWTRNLPIHISGITPCMQHAHRTRIVLKKKVKISIFERRVLFFQSLLTLVVYHLLRFFCGFSCCLWYWNKCRLWENKSSLQALLIKHWICDKQEISAVVSSMLGWILIDMGPLESLLKILSQEFSSHMLAGK